MNPETIGRTYNTTRYGVHSRRVAGDGKWYGSAHYKSREEAEEALRSVGKPILDGMVSFPPGREPYEYRIVRIESVCTVEHVEQVLI